MAKKGSKGVVGLSLWERIQTDPGFVRSRREIQVRYGLPLDFDIRTEPEKWTAWLSRGSGNAANSPRGTAFLEEVQALFHRYQIPETWQEEFLAEIAGRPAGQEVRDGALPKFNLVPDGIGRWRWECVITPETDLTDPAVLKLIQDQQKEHAGDPPNPGKDPRHPRRLDWRPVLEWQRRHPLFSLEEVAQKLGIPVETISQEFSRLERSERNKQSRRTK